MRQSLIILLALLGVLGSPSAYPQAGDPLSQYQQAVQLRMDDLVRSSAQEFFSKAHLSPSTIEQVIATPKFNIDMDSARIASLDLRIVLVSDHPPEVIRQLRQYIGQSLNREGFVLDQFAEPGSQAPQLALTLDVRNPPVPFMRFDLPGHWREYMIFGLMLAAFLSALLFACYLLVLPFAARNRRKLVLQRQAEDQTEIARETRETGLPPLPEITDTAGVTPSLDDLLSLEKERQHFPIWLDERGARMADVQSIRKAFEVLPFDEAIDMLSCLDEADRDLVLSRLNLNPSVRERIRREAVARQPVLST